jgi:DNA helicase-2/ATP-dependent DNA helicase PcrA
VAFALQHCATQVPKKAAVAWTQFVATVWQLEDQRLRPDPAALLGLAMEAGYEDYLKETYDNYPSRLEDLAQLRSYARQFSTLQDFLGQLALLANVDAEAHRPTPDDDDERLLLSTVHQAKGLEFDVVFIIMLCEGAFPSQQAIQGDGDIEEERRLMYVAITRARDHLYLCYPLLRSRRSGGGDEFQRPSRFLGEIPTDLADLQDFSPFLA